jgi:hypothetical protein
MHEYPKKARFHPSAHLHCRRQGSAQGKEVNAPLNPQAKNLAKESKGNG